MIDIHSHILPGMDDGAKTKEDLITMAREAIRDGITSMIATPHHMNGVYLNPMSEVITQVEIANQILQSNNIPLTIYPSQEIRVYENLLDDLRNHRILTLDSSRQYLLLELPTSTVPHYIDQLIFDILVLGVIPIIPHPERNAAIREQPNLLYRMVKAGAMAQLTATSVIGLFGKEIERFSEQLIEHGLVHMIASDAHNVGARGPKLSAAYERIRDYGGSVLEEEFKSNALNVFQGKGIWTIEPIKFERKKFLGIF